MEMKKGIAFSLLWLLLGCGDHYVQPTEFNRFTGEVLKLGKSGDECADMLFRKSDQTIVTFHVRNWPPVWEGMKAEILLDSNETCGYRVISSRELK
jgi:hypothetical protein